MNGDVLTTAIAVKEALERAHLRLIDVALLADTISYLERERAIYFRSEMLPDGTVDLLAKRDLDELDELIRQLKEVQS